MSSRVMTKEDIFELMLLFLTVFALKIKEMA